MSNLAMIMYLGIPFVVFAVIILAVRILGKPQHGEEKEQKVREYCLRQNGLVKIDGHRFVSDGIALIGKHHQRQDVIPVEVYQSTSSESFFMAHVHFRSTDDDNYESLGICATNVCLPEAMLMHFPAVTDLGKKMLNIAFHLFRPGNLPEVNIPNTKLNRNFSVFCSQPNVIFHYFSEAVMETLSGIGNFTIYTQGNVMVIRIMTLPPVKLSFLQRLEQIIKTANTVLSLLNQRNTAQDRI